MNPAKAFSRLAWRLVAVNGGGSVTRSAQALHDLVGAMLGAAEHEGTGHVVVFENVDQHLELVGLIDVDDALVHAVHRGGNGGHFNAHGVGEQAACEI